MPLPTKAARNVRCTRGWVRRHSARAFLAGVFVCLLLTPERPKADDAYLAVAVNAGSPAQAGAGAGSSGSQLAASEPSGAAAPQQIQLPNIRTASTNATELTSVTPHSSIAANPAAVNIVTGSGWLGQQLGLQSDFRHISRRRLGRQRQLFVFGRRTTGEVELQQPLCCQPEPRPGQARAYSGSSVQCGVPAITIRLME